MKTKQLFSFIFLFATVMISNSFDKTIRKSVYLKAQRLNTRRHSPHKRASWYLCINMRHD